jgi:hypothetical protein
MIAMLHKLLEIWGGISIICTLAILIAVWRKM